MSYWAFNMVEKPIVTYSTLALRKAPADSFSGYCVHCCIAHHTIKSSTCYDGIPLMLWYHELGCRLRVSVSLKCLNNGKDEQPPDQYWLLLVNRFTWKKIWRRYFGLIWGWHAPSGNSDIGISSFISPVLTENQVSIPSYCISSAYIAEFSSNQLVSFIRWPGLFGN